MAEDLSSGKVGTRRQGEGAGAAESSGGVGFPAPHGLQLNVMDAAEEGRGFAVIEGDEGFGDGVFTPALRIALDGRGSVSEGEGFTTRKTSIEARSVSGAPVIRRSGNVKVRTASSPSCSTARSETACGPRGSGG